MQQLFGIIGWVILAILVAFICGLVVSVPLRGFAEDNVLATFSTIDGETAKGALQEQFGIVFPTSVTEFHRASKGDKAYWIQFHLSREALNNLFKDSPYMTCDFPLQSNYKPVFEYARLLGPEQWVRMSWWTPNNAATYVGGECTGTDYKIFRMFTDVTNSTQWIFYMEVVQT
jgi:hypothetical protein